MRLSRTFLLLAVTIGLLSQASPATAELRNQPLEKGMGPAQVVRAWGPPDQRVALETKRQDLWFYKSAVVTFQEGSVLDWQRCAGDCRGSDGQLLPAAATLSDAAEDSGKVVAAVAKESESVKVVDEILNEIMKASGSDDPESSSGGPTVITPGMQLPTAPPPPPGSSDF